MLFCSTTPSVVSSRLESKSPVALMGAVRPVPSPGVTVALTSALSLSLLLYMSGDVGKRREKGRNTLVATPVVYTVACMKHKTQQQGRLL